MAGKYNFVGKDDDSNRADTNNEVVLETDENSDFSDKKPSSMGAESKWKSSDNDVVKLDGDNEDGTNDPNKA